MFSEGHKQLPSLVKAGMSHMAPQHGLIRRVLQRRVGLVAIKEPSPAGAQRNYTSPPLDQIGVDKPEEEAEGAGGVGGLLDRNRCVSLQVGLGWL